MYTVHYKEGIVILTRGFRLGLISILRAWTVHGQLTDWLRFQKHVITIISSSMPSSASQANSMAFIIQLSNLVFLTAYVFVIQISK